MTVLVCGGRDYADRAAAFAALDAIHAATPIHRILTGGCRGADFLARAWFLERTLVGTEIERASLMMTEIAADWNRHGKAAGPIRNRKLVTELQDERESGQDVLVLAFQGGKGTANTVALARKLGLPVKEIA